MAVSHFCEKVRWTLDYKGIAFTRKTFLPGLHIKPIRKLSNSSQSSVPVLQNGDVIIQDSRAIVHYLETQYPNPSLYPTDASDLEQMQAWQLLADDTVGIAVRHICYHVLLEHPKLLIPILAQDGPWYSKPLLTVFFPKLKRLMREKMHINQTSFDESTHILDTVMQSLRIRLQHHQFLVGERFSIADLTFAALLAPLARVKGYGVPWPQQVPEALQQLDTQYKDVLDWVRDLYQYNRKP